MTTATQLYTSNPLALTGAEKIAADAASGITGGVLTQAIADLFRGTKGADIASSTTTDIGAAVGVFLHITGTTTITGLGTAAAGTLRLLTFDGALTLTHNATSLILPTSANITTVAGDSALLLSEGSGNWRCLGYWPKSGAALRAAAPSVNALSIASGVVAIDCALGDYFPLAATAAMTSFTFSNLPASGKAQTIMLRITQDATGSRVATWPSSFKWAGGTAGVLSTAANSVDVLALTTFDQGTTWNATLAKAFA